MSNQEQAIAVKKALDLSVKISETEAELSRLSAESFRSQPSAPQHETVTVKYPEIEPNTPFWTAALLPALFFLPYIIVYYFLIYKKRIEEDTERIRNSDEYKAQCAAIDEAAKRRQAEIDEKYRAAMAEYEKAVPEYQRELEAWTREHAEKTEAAQSVLSNARRELAKHYEDTRIVPMQYRDIEALRYIFDMISSSDYSIKEAIGLYDKDRQRRLEEQKIYEQQIANRLADEQIQLTYEQNDLLDEHNSISDRASKDARNAAIAEIVQRHNTNKMLKKAFRK